MPRSPTIAIDAMGGDSGAETTISGATRANRLDPDLRFHFYGDQAVIEEQLERHRSLREASEVHHSPESIEASEKPSQAIRRNSPT